MKHYCPSCHFATSRASAGEGVDWRVLQSSQEWPWRKMRRRHQTQMLHLTSVPHQHGTAVHVMCGYVKTVILSMTSSKEANTSPYLTSIHCYNDIVLCNTDYCTHLYTVLSPYSPLISFIHPLCTCTHVTITIKKVL